MNLRTMARVFGVMFLAFGVLGFVPGITSMHTGDPAAENLLVGGPGHGMLLGLFHVNVLHNLFHAAFGIWGLVAAKSFANSRVYFRGVGIIYATLAVLGLIPFLNIHNTFGLIPIHGADVLLHVALAIPALYLGFAAKSTDVTDTTSAAAPHV